MTLEGVRAVVTGGSQGLGYAIAERFVAEGARVFLCARSADQLGVAGRRLQEEAGGVDAVRWQQGDVSVPLDVKAVVEGAIAAFGGLDVLVCNAGVHGPKGRSEDVDWNAWMSALNINLGGSVLCCRAVLPHFRARGAGKIIVLSGGGATKPMPFLSAYAASKAALVRFCETLAAEVQDAGIDVNAIAPGALNTRLLDDVLEAGPGRVGQTLYEQALAQKREGGASLETAAALCAFFASPQSDGITGRLVSAVWDPWDELSARRDELAGSDIYTLRRIVPEDRGKSWSRGQ
jgi:NAD(P)-dependent dehydrogenase (short-subunit alcohol dehydrogenase family)